MACQNSEWFCNLVNLFPQNALVIPAVWQNTNWLIANLGENDVINKSYNLLLFRV